MVTTPDAIGTYQRLMAEAFDERDFISVATGFQSIFGRPETNAQTIFSMDAEVVDIDIIRGNEDTTALVPRGGINRSLGSLNQPLNEQKFTTPNRVYPLSVEYFDIGAAQLQKRLAGEPLYAPMGREARLRVLAAKGTVEMTKRTVRMFERLASQSARTGKQDSILGTSDSDLQYDFRRNANNTFTPAVKWDNASAVIMSNIDAAGSLIRQNGHMRMNVGILGTGMMDAFIRDSEVRAVADNKGFELIRVSDTNPVPRELEFMVMAGFDARGAIFTPAGYKVWLFTYNEGYTSAGTFVPYMPVDQALFFDSRARNDRYFGPPETLPETPSSRAFYQEAFGIGADMIPGTDMIKGSSRVIMPGMFHHDAYGSIDRTNYTARTQSAPIFANTMSDAFVLLTDGLT